MKPLQCSCHAKDVDMALVLLRLTLWYENWVFFWCTSWKLSLPCKECDLCGQRPFMPKANAWVPMIRRIWSLLSLAVWKGRLLGHNTFPHRWNSIKMPLDPLKHTKIANIHSVQVETVDAFHDTSEIIQTTIPYWTTWDNHNHPKLNTAPCTRFVRIC